MPISLIFKDSPPHSNVDSSTLTTNLAIIFTGAMLSRMLCNMVREREMTINGPIKYPMFLIINSTKKMRIKFTTKMFFKETIYNQKRQKIVHYIN